MFAEKVRSPAMLPTAQKPALQRSVKAAPPVDAFGVWQAMSNRAAAARSAPAASGGGLWAQRAFSHLAGVPTQAAIQRMPMLGFSRDSYDRGSDQTIQRKCADCDEEDKATIRTKPETSGDAGGALDSREADDRRRKVEGRIDRLATASPPQITPDAVFRGATSGSGTAIPYQRDMESAFGQRFDDVRAYLGRTDEMTSLRAEAATRAGRIAFRDMNPSRDTVAHELVHIVQARGGETASCSGPARLSTPDEPAEQEATRLAAHAAQGRAVQVKQAAGGGIERKEAPAPAGKEPKPSGAAEIPQEILAAVAQMLEGSENEAEDATLSRIGRMAVQMLGPAGIVAIARKAGVRGAEQREQELMSQSGGTIHRQAGEAAAGAAGTMWWLTLVDGPLPIGDIIYGALIIGAAYTASRAIRQCRCTIRYAPPDIMADCPPRVYGMGITIGDCQNAAKFTVPQKCRQYYGHCSFTQ
jgi:hypothetical protein